MRIGAFIRRWQATVRGPGAWPGRRCVVSALQLVHELASVLVKDRDAFTATEIAYRRIEIRPERRSRAALNGERPNPIARIAKAQGSDKHADVPVPQSVAYK